MHHLRQLHTFLKCSLNSTHCNFNPIFAFLHLYNTPAASIDYGDTTSEFYHPLLDLFSIVFTQEDVGFLILCQVFNPRFDVLWFALATDKDRGLGINLDFVTFAHEVDRVTLLNLVSKLTRYQSGTG